MNRRMLRDYHGTNNSAVALNNSHSFRVRYLPHFEGVPLHSREIDFLTDLTLEVGSMDTRKDERI
jgi:hypothetical protein